MKSKATEIAERLGMECVVNASKPGLKGFKKALTLLNVNKDNIAIIGDQIFTDVWGGNRFGIKTILVMPIAKKEWFIARMKRPLERYILRKYEEMKRGQENESNK
ncbi:hypothetical protein D3C73_1414710 [compost metagenome]